MQTETFLLKPLLPYDLNLSLQRLKRDPIYVSEKDAICRTLRINRSLYLVKIYFQKPNETNIQAEIVCLEGDLEGENVRNTLERMLAIHCNLHSIYGYMNAIPELTGLTKKFAGLHIFQDPDPFECLVKLIVAQQITTSFAADLTRNLIEAVSETVVYGHQLFFVFPSASQLAELGVGDLAKRKFSGRKAEYVIDFARLVHERKINLPALRNLSDEAVMDKLLKIRGVGPWTANCFMLFGLGRKDLVPASDIAIQKAAQRVYGLSRRPAKSEVIQLAEEWSPVGSYVSRYLWETLRT